MATFQLLQDHCLQHAEPEHQMGPEHNDATQNHTEPVQAHSVDQQILIEITESSVPGFHAPSVSLDGPQYVVVYDVPTNE